MRDGDGLDGNDGGLRGGLETLSERGTDEVDDLDRDVAELADDDH